MNNSEEKRDAREKLEERLVAMLLGEVDDKERAELERLMRENSEIARFYKEMEQTADLVRKACVVSSKEVNSQEEKVPQGLSIERRRKLLECFKKPPVSNNEVKYEWYQIRGKFLINLACVAILMLVCLTGGLILHPSLSSAKTKAGFISYHKYKNQLEPNRELRETDGDGKQQTEMAQAEGLEQAPQTAGGVLSQTFYRKEDFKKPALQTVDSLAVAQPAGVAGKPVSGDIAGGSGFAGGYGGGRAAVSESLSKNVETLGRRARYASEPPGGPPPGNMPTITPPPTQPMRPSTATALKSEKLMETPATPAAAFDKTPVLGDKPSLGVEFSRPAGDETATRGTATYGNAISEVGEKRAYYFAYTPARNALDDASGGRVEPDKGDGLAWKDEVAKELYFEDSKQVVNGTISSSKIEKEAVNLQLPAPNPKETPTDLSAVVMAKQKSDARVPGDNAMAKKSAEIEQKVERLLLATNVLARKDTEVAELRDLPAEKKPASSPKPIQPEILTADNRFSTFSLNVSDVSFKTAAASLQNKVLPEPMSIREEEFINAFNYNDPAPPPGAKIGFYWERARFPFAHNRDIVRFSVQTASAGRSLNRPMNLVILLDNSGSMERPDRIAIISEAMKVLARQMRKGDKISVIAFARSPRVIIDGMIWENPDAFLSRVLTLNPHGGTNLEEAMKLGYSTALKHFIPGGVNRVILLTDGAANLGDVDPESLKNMVMEHRQKGVALDCFGIGWEGYNDELLEVLSRNGDGRYGFMNEPDQAPVDFANQLAGALKVAAADVKVQVEFNPSRVISYRQIGYARHQLTKEQFRDNTVDAAEIGEAESGNALYIIEVNPDGSGNIGFFRVRYKDPETGAYREQEWSLIYQPNVPSLEKANPTLRLAATAGIFAEWLAQNPYSSHINLADLERIMSGVPEFFAPDQKPRQLLTMINQARMITGK